MDQRPFGPTGKRVARIGQGTWKMEEDERSAAIAALRLGIDLGMTHIDTAELYGAGRVEELVGEAIAGRRDDVFLVSKVLPDNASREGTIAACERSLKRLRTEWLDCYLLHWPSHHRLEETIAAFEHLREQGKIRSWGLSNFDEHELAVALALAGPNRIACNQVLYHLRERSIEHAVVPFCAANGIAIVGYTPFGRSSFPPGGTSGKALQRVAERHSVTPRQVALAFLTRRPGVFTIPKASNVEHVRENAAAAELVLDTEDIATLKAAFPLGSRRTGVPIL
ncbi:MAG TPA: aldo/keto reductase [Polyangiaceae bacterium]|nr:aldo/keto reductase [Polyangiaceae bacterium]